MLNAKIYHGVSVIYGSPCISEDSEEKPEVTITPSMRTNSILKPEDYSKFGMPSEYIFWPTANVFVHPTVMQEENALNSIPNSKNNKPLLPSPTSSMVETCKKKRLIF